MHQEHVVEAEPEREATSAEGELTVQNGALDLPGDAANKAMAAAAIQSRSPTLERKPSPRGALQDWAKSFNTSLALMP